MSDFTIEQLKALKEGTTEGPWEWYWDQGIISLRGPGGEPIATDLTVADADMIAAAPALLDALIAEKRAHQKLRAEIEGFLRSCIESAETLELNAMTAYSPEACETASIVERDTAAALTRILEATDE